MKTSQAARKYGISEAAFYNWKAKYGGMDTSQLKRLKELKLRIVGSNECTLI